MTLSNNSGNVEINTNDLQTVPNEAFATDGEVAAEEKKASNANPSPNAYAGNVMYTKPQTKNGRAYAMVMVRFVNNNEVEPTPVQIFLDAATFNSHVGDTVVFSAKRLVPCYDNDYKLMTLGDGTPILRASGTGLNPKLTNVRYVGPGIKPEVIGEIKSTGFKKLLAMASPLMAKWFGLDKTEP